MADNSGLLFPPEISFGSKGGPQYSTSIVVRKSGYEKRNQNWTYPLHRYDVAFGVRLPRHMDLLMDFFHLHYGRAVAFLYKDWIDAAATSAEGVTTSLTGSTFQMWKRYASGAVTKDRKITRPLAAASVYVNGVLQSSGYSVNAATGVITFTGAPGGTVTWAGNYYLPCRFDTDFLDVEIVDKNNTEGLILDTSVPVVEVRE